MNNQNMSIWSQVEKTAPEATKSAKVNGQQITSISGQHMIKRATEMFGPVGIGWGWTVAEERFDQGGEIRNDKGDLIGHEVGHTIRVKLWFMQGDKRGEVEQYGCTPFTYKSKWGVTTDTEAPKKSLTDAVKKALAMLGFSADIFLGLYDDRDYVAEREAEAQIEQAENKEAEAARQAQERIDWLKAALETMAAAVTLHELSKLHATYVRSATRRHEDKFVTRLARAFEDRKAELEPKQENAA
ncbi:Rad52/Rad22 family DNA repair protein [Stutzerimonas stutzeri]|uniref:Rad52/Rad22 family DNA repair protein n=1 Tax=Stutzerimonas stutzeri TaxID=316 RepID=UPI000F77D424|nr:Rad52/Rad22 family DNA repair protein [Stutzerimonas stutzeri]RRV80388.1 hypothetical protein EGI92_12445 [Stutzerimonas stutzeri]